MKIDVYTATGTKKGTVDLPTALFEAPVNEGLMHQALVRQQSNRRTSIAHVKSRGEVRGSTRKLFAQKGTGRARRGSANSPLLRGGGKIFGPRNNANFTKDMPRNMRRAALKSCLSMQAKHEKIVGLEGYPEEIKTKKVLELLKKMPVDLGRKIVIVLPKAHSQLALSVRNIPNIKTIQAAYLNPEDVLGAHHIIFMVDALKKAEEVFGGVQKSEAQTSKTAVKKSTKTSSTKTEEDSPSKK
jgi:large subunit ribosomal protein L4